MPPPPRSEVPGLILAVAVAAVAALLAVRQYLDWRSREPGLAPDDVRHFARQDLRRIAGIGAMLLLAVGVLVGSRVEPSVGGRPNPIFIRTWAGVFLLIFVLLALAMLDWMATRLYAVRHRRAILQERIDDLREELRRQAGRGNGNGNGRAGPLDGAPS